MRRETRKIAHVSLEDEDVEASSNTSATPTGALENPANRDVGFLRLPTELVTEVISYFITPGPNTRVNVQSNGSPLLPTLFLERSDALRALSQTCVSYRRWFLPLAWESFDMCVEARAPENRKSFYKHVGTGLIRKSNGLSKDKHLGEYVRNPENVAWFSPAIRRKKVIPTFAACIQSLPNLHTLHILHAHTQMTTALKEGFEGIKLCTIQTLIIQGYTHEVLKCCPNVKNVYCIRDEGSKLITMIAKHCKKVERIRGFYDAENLMKRIVKAMPNLRSIELSTRNFGKVIPTLPKLKKLDSIDILTHEKMDGPYSVNLQNAVNAMKKYLQNQTEVKQKKRLRICHAVEKEHRYYYSDLPDVDEHEQYEDARHYVDVEL